MTRMILLMPVPHHQGDNEMYNEMIDDNREKDRDRE